uniref:Uncharacterized protein n=1 Tax=Avena sativa TaxID=4498 RepID=A0ACD6A1P8_AVESA
MAPKTGAPRGKKKTHFAVTKAVEKKKSCRRLMNPALATPSRSLAPGSCRKKQVSRSIKVGLHFPVGRIGRYLKEGRYSQRIGFGAPVYLAAVLEYLATEVLELAGQAAKDNKKIRIIPRHVMLSVMRDEELSKLLAVLPSRTTACYPASTSPFLAMVPRRTQPNCPRRMLPSRLRRPRSPPRSR